MSVTGDELPAVLPAPEATPAVMAAPNPRIGGGTGSDSWWTGGSNMPAKRRTRAKTILARRPTDFRGAEKIESACRKRLPEERRLGLSEETTYTISLSSWIREIKKELEDCGLDTVFYIYNPTSPVQEVSMFDMFGTVTDLQLDHWISHLRVDGVLKANNTNEDVCYFDIDNLDWSGDMMKNSISWKLWRDIEGLSPGMSGPEIFLAVCKRTQHTSASTCRALVTKLQGLRLNKEPGMDVNRFSLRIIEMLEKIEKCSDDSIPNDLSLVVAECYQNTGVGPYDLEATTWYNKCDDDPKCMAPRQFIARMKAKYTSLESKNQWPHKNQKQKQDELAAMNGKLNALTQKFDSFKPGGQANNQNKQGGKNKTGGNASANKRKCYHCGKEDHIKPHCPTKDDGKPDVVARTGGNSGGGNDGNSGGSQNNSIPAWMNKGPGSGEPETKTVEGVEYKYCHNCKLGPLKKPMWRSGKKAHVTADCKSKKGALAAMGTLAEEEAPITGPLIFQGFP